MGVIGFTVICVVLYLIFSSTDGEDGCLSGIFKLGAGVGASWLLIVVFLAVLSVIVGFLASL